MSYDDYFDTEVEYIGTIPKSWKLIRNKHIFNKTKVIVGPNWDKYNVLSLTKNGVIIKDIERNEGKMPSDFSIYQIVNPGNLLMCLFDIDVTPRCVGYIENKGIVSAAYTELSATDNINMKYYYWWYLMLDIDKQLLHLSKNLRNSLSTEDFMALPVVKPPLEEQQQIADYLDKQTAKIDATIAKNEELIQLLEEKRVALINQVVTKGLNPDVHMKDSGVEWIGEIPEHWEMMKLKYHGSILGGYAFKSNDFTDFGVKVVKITNVQSMKFNWGECFYLPPTYLQEHSEFIINKGDIVFALTRPIISTGIKAAIYDENEPALANQRTGIFKKHTDSLLSQFLYYIIYSDYFKEDFKSKITATNQPNISPLDIGEIKIIIPPIKEQKDIITKLNKETSRINKAITKINDNIILLEEYKTSLIHHVVTGKIDVRGEEI